MRSTVPAAPDSGLRFRWVQRDTPLCQRLLAAGWSVTRQECTLGMALLLLARPVLPPGREGHEPVVVCDVLQPLAPVSVPPAASSSSGERLRSAIARDETALARRQETREKAREQQEQEEALPPELAQAPSFEAQLAAWRAVSTGKKHAKKSRNATKRARTPRKSSTYRGQVKPAAASPALSDEDRARRVALLEAEIEQLQPTNHEAE